MSPNLADPRSARRLAILGAPIDIGASQPGAIMGPAALRTAGIVQNLRELGHAVEDQGDLAPPQPLALDPALSAARARNLAHIAAWSRLLSDRTYDIARTGACPIVLGGDHSLSIGTVNGVARHAREVGRELFVLWLDAHADFNTPATTPSGNMHGMSAALLAGEPGLEAVFGEHAGATIRPANLRLFGIRSIDRGERALLRARGVDVIDMRHIDEFGVGVLMRGVLDAVAAAGALLHVSFDIDFLDPTVAPGVGTTVPGGATLREAHLVMELLYDSGLVTSLDVVELNPFLDVRGHSALLLVDLIASLFGRQIIERETTPNFVLP
ncbi:MAG TPA: arginase [Beijerinckiaceae bacterium]|nr:arginase [Beijerinckiaceae bacterium]